MPCHIRLAVFFTLGLLAKCFFAAPPPTSRSDASFSWGKCESFGINSTDSNLQCGSLEVPMDYHDSSAGTARLAAIKYSTTAQKRLGTVFFNPGGPGQSGLKVIAAAGQFLSLGFQGAFDIISWDPRGVGSTFPGPVTCFNNQEEAAAFWTGTVAGYINETISGRFNSRDLDELYSQADPTEQKFKVFTERCQSGPVGPYLKYIGVTSTARDLVSLGDAILGKGEPINYWGVSYGTVIGFNFVNMFPERAGHVVLDGVLDASNGLSFESFYPTFVDTEKTYSGLADGCAKAGRAGCKLIEITGDDASGNDVKALLAYAHDVTLKLYREGVPVPVVPGYFKDILFHLLYTPQTWSELVNGGIYQFVAFALQAAQARNLTIDGGAKYNVPSGNFSMQNLLPSETDVIPLNSTTYSSVAIFGADDFDDDNTTIKDVFDIIVKTTRQVIPSFGTVWDIGYGAYKWPVRSVERAPPFSSKHLKNPILLIGNTADPVTPFANAEKYANLFGENAFLLEQLGFGHTSTAQVSSCTLRVMANYFANSTLPEGRSAQCPVDNANLFPVLNGQTTTTKRSSLWWRWR